MASCHLKAQLAVARAVVLSKIDYSQLKNVQNSGSFLRSLHRHKKAAEHSQPNVMSSNLIPTKSVSNGPFSFDKDGFNIDGILRIGWPSLYEMLFPHEISGIRAQKRARGRAEATITFPWLVAHMTFYEIDFEPEDTVAELTELLADNVKRGTCNKLPPRVRAIATELEQLFKAANPEPPKAQPKIAKLPRKTSAQQQRSLDRDNEYSRAFKKFKVPVDLANHNRSLFLAKYFLSDQDGQPDPSITPFPILLPGLSDRLAMQQAADTVPGLKTSSGGEGEFRILVIGWNRATIYEIAEQISADQASLRDEMSKILQERLRRHYSFIKTMPLSPKPTRFAMESAQGTYALACNGIADRWGDADDEYSLRITHSKIDGWVGIFAIGVIYGIMRLDTDRKALLARCKATEKNEARMDEGDYEVSLEELGTTDEEDDASEEVDVFSDLNSEDSYEEEDEFILASYENLLSRKRKKTPIKAQKISAKRSSTSSNRLYFKWRGREHGEGDVANDGRKKKTGYLHFADATCMTFQGTISNDLIGKNVQFQGFKISNDGGAVTRTYREYSERAGNIFDDSRWRHD